MKKLVVLSGAGISVESGLRTFRDAGGLWEGHRVEEVATPEAFRRNPLLVNEFYNQRRGQLAEVEPNEAHLLLAELQNHFDVRIVTQNVDDLHERAGSRHVLHLHGELTWACSSKNRSKRKHIGYRRIEDGEKWEDGSLMRPDIVWFGEEVPEMENAILEVCDADAFLVVGTSLAVYPAAGLIRFVAAGAKKYVIDPTPHSNPELRHFNVISETATRGMRILYPKLVADEPVS